MGSSLLSAADLSRAEIEELLRRADEYAAGGGRRHDGAVVGLAFFEASVRTRVGFEVAAARLGAQAVAIQQAKRTVAMGYDESVEDALRSIEGWFDAVCLRSASGELPVRAAARGITVVNCGSGSAHHPSQALVDLFAIRRQMDQIDGLRIALVGNQLESRSARSLALALGRFEGVEIRDIAPRPGLHLPPEVLAASGAAVTAIEVLDLRDVDVVYVSGLPAGTPDGDDLSLDEQATMRITVARAAALAAHARVLCALPRLDEIESAVDDLPAAGYFEQSRTALWMRMAVLDRALA